MAGMKTKTLAALAAVLFLAVAAFAQGAPDCQFSSTFTSATNGTAIQNTSTPCVAWRVTYFAVGMTALSIQIEGGATSTGPWAAIASGAILQGSNPLTDPNSATLVVNGTVYYPWVRLNVTVFTPTGASGTITARTYGYKGTSAAMFSGSGVVFNPMTTLGDMIYGAASGFPTREPGNTSTAQKFLSQTGDGTNSSQPSWQPIPAAGNLTYYWTNTASSIATYLQQTAAPFSPKTTQPHAGLAAGTDTLINFATNAGIPNLTFIPAGPYGCHVHADRTGAGGTVNLQCLFVEVNAAGADIAVIGTSEASSALNTVENEFNLFYIDGNTYTLTSSASRIVARVQAVVGTASGPTVNLFVGGTADSHITLPSSTVDATNFVPYTGATADVNLGAHALFITGPGANFEFLPDSIGTPTAPTVTHGGTPGLVTYAYKISWITPVGNGPESSATSTSTGNATLSGTNFNIVTPPACPANATGFIVDRTTDPNSNTGILPVTGTCGVPIHDIYPGAVLPIILTDISAGLFSSRLTSLEGRFGEMQTAISPELAAIISSATTETIAKSPEATGGFFASEIGKTPVGINAVGVGHDANDQATGLGFFAVHAGNVNSNGILTAANSGLALFGNGTVPGWSAGYGMFFAGNLDSGSATFEHVAAFDCVAGSFANPGTSTNACLHNLQVPVGGSTIYFLLEEGGLPSLFAGTVTVTPLKSTTGQVFVCANTAGLLVRSATACVGTI
jgi:hypothetical protein